MQFRDFTQRPLFWPLVVWVLYILVADQFPNPPLTVPAGAQTWTGTVTQPPRVTKERSQLTLALHEQPQGLPQKILLTVVSDLPFLQTGDRVEWDSKLKIPVPYQNPGGFNYARFLKRQGIDATAFIQSGSELRLKARPDPGYLQRVADHLKNKTREALTSLGSSQAQAVTLALLWGDESGIDEHTEDLFRNQGLSHLLVISGLHFSVVALMLFGLGLIPFRIFPTLCLYLPARKIAAAFSLLILTFYFFICEPNPSVTRAYVAVACFLSALILDRSRDAVNILCLAALVILFIHPNDLFSVSFQFSFLAVAGLLFVFPKIKSHWDGFLPGRDIFSRAGHFILDLLLVNLSVFLMITPLAVFYFYRFNLNGLFMNLWAVPLIEMILVPLGLAGFVLLPIVPVAGLFLLGLTVKMLDGTLFILDLAAKHLPGQGLVFPPHGYELLLYYLVVALLCFSVSARVKKTACLCFALFLIVDMAWWFGWPLLADRFRVTQIDVGQGDSMLVELPQGRRILVDGGGSTYSDIGENVIIPFLLHERVTRLDAVCATHADTDHYLGLVPVLSQFPVKELWWNGLPSASPLYESLFQAAAKQHIPLRTLHAGDEFAFGTANIRILSPGADEKISTRDNHHSVVMRIEALGKSALLTGDIEKRVEQRLVSSHGKALHADYLKVAHHGSHSSSDWDFLQAVSPQIASLGAKSGNRFGHPHADTLAKYERLGIQVFRTDLDGAVRIDLSGVKPEVTTMRED